MSVRFDGLTTWPPAERSFALEDGTQLLLNTQSAVNLRFDASERRILLVAGEIMVATRHGSSLAADPRPLLVETAEGSIRSLGTRFTVRQRPERTDVVVLESAVAISSRLAPGSTRVLHAGEQTQFSHETIETPTLTGEQADAWTRGQLLADEQRLGDFLAELDRNALYATEFIEPHGLSGTSAATCAQMVAPLFG